VRHRQAQLGGTRFRHGPAIAAGAAAAIGG